MTSNAFRELALALPGAIESSHMGHPDFRANGKIFATLQYPDENWGMVKVPPEQQEEFVRNHPKVFVPVKGVWGRQGSTSVLLKEATESILREAMQMAWKNTASTSQTRRTAKKASAGSRRRGR